MAGEHTRGTGRGGFMTPADAWIWYLEGDPRLRWTISAVMVLDATPDWDRLVARFDRASRHDPRFRQKVIEPPMRAAPPRWTTDRWFDLDYHVRRVAAPAPGTLADVLAFAARSAMSGLDKDRPLWQATLVEGLTGGRAALVVKLHHALTDGVGGLQLALHLVDPHPGEDPQDPLPDAPEAENIGRIGLWGEITRFQLRRAFAAGDRMTRAIVPTMRRSVTDPAGLAREARSLVASVVRAVRPVLDTSSPVMTARSLSWEYGTLAVPFDELRSAARTAGFTLNDAFLAGLTGGLRRYHEAHGSVPAELRMNMPISLRREGDPEGGNRVTIMRFAIPIAEADVRTRLGQIHTAARAARDEPSVPHFDTIATGLAPLTPLAVAPMATHMDFTASNVPGYPHAVHICGAEVLQVYPFGPTAGGAMNATMMSYRDSCCIGVNTDAEAVPDAPVLYDCLADGFEEVLAVGGRRHRPVIVGDPGSLT